MATKYKIYDSEPIDVFKKHPFPELKSKEIFRKEVELPQKRIEPVSKEIVPSKARDIPNVALIAFQKQKSFNLRAFESLRKDMAELNEKVKQKNPKVIANILKMWING